MQLVYKQITKYLKLLKKWHTKTNAINHVLEFEWNRKKNILY